MMRAVRPGPLPFLLTGQAHESFADSVRRHFGFDFPGARGRALDEGVGRALHALGESEAGLLERLKRDDPEALRALATELTVGESYFFRDRPHFAVVERAARSGRTLRMWSAGCSSGEEAYSMAIVALEASDGRCAPNVLGTDLNPTSVARARAATYGTWSFRGVPNGVRNRWFSTDGQRWRPVEQVRTCARFELGNLLHAPPFAPGEAPDVIFCRNVLLYLTAEAIDRVARVLTAALAPGGWLVLGPSDPLLDAPGLALDRSLGFFAYRRATDLDLTQPERKPHADRAAASPRPGARPAAPPPREHPSPLFSLSPPLPEAPQPASPLLEWRPEPPRAAPDTSPLESAAAVVQARRLADAGDGEGALAILRGQPCSTAEALTLRATIRQELGDHAGAARDAEAALVFDQALAIAHVVAASARAEGGDRAGALRATRNARKALAGAPPDAPAPHAGGATTADLLAACRAVERLVGAAEGRPAPARRYGAPGGEAK